VSGLLKSSRKAANKVVNSSIASKFMPEGAKEKVFDNTLGGMLIDDDANKTTQAATPQVGQEQPVVEKARRDLLKKKSSALNEFGMDESTIL
jgi:hypothetical protein